MNARRTCGARNQADGICLQAPLRDAEFCFWHDPGHAKEAADARRLGGQRRKREATVAGAYDVDGLGTIPDIRRVLEIAIFDLLSLENSVARARGLFSGVQVAAKLLEVGEFEERLAAIESVLGPRMKDRKGGRR